MPKISAGILLFRRRSGRIQVLLAHPGGPYFKNKDSGAWSIPKGEVEENEDHLDAAKREFAEETGCVPIGPFIELASIKLRSGKIVHAWACEGDFEPQKLKSNLFHMEWPPRSGKVKEFPEIDRVEWFSVDDARRKTSREQMQLIEDLLKHC